MRFWLLLLLLSFPAKAHINDEQTTNVTAKPSLKQHCQEIYSFARAALTEGWGVVRSPILKANFLLNPKKHPELKNFFDPEKPVPPPPVPASEAFKWLDSIDEALRGDGFPTLRLHNHGFDLQWHAVATGLQSTYASSGDTLSEFVAFFKQFQIVFLKRGGQLIPIKIQASPANSFPLTAIPHDDGSGALSEEFTIRKYILKNWNEQSDGLKIRRMGPAANDLRYPRDSDFDWDGDIISGLRQNGGRTVPNLQKILRTAGREAVRVSDSGAIEIQPDVKSVVQRIYKLARPGSDKFEADIQTYAERQVRHALLLRYFEAHPELTMSFAFSAEYLQAAEAFIDSHFAYLGATQFDVAIGILAESILDAVPGLTFNWVKNHAGAVPETVSDLVSALGNVAPYASEWPPQETFQDEISAALEALQKVEGQLARHPIHNRLTNVLGNLGWITSPRRSFPNNVIANLGMTKAPESGRYTITAYFDPGRADGYFGPAANGYVELSAFKPSTEAVSQTQVVSILLEISQAQTFENQVRLVEKYAPQLSKYLTTGKAVPATVREFAEKLFDESFGEQICKRASPTSDPNCVNRFFQDSFKAFQKMNQYHQLFDLVHGMTSILVRDHVGKLAYLERAFAAQWKAYSFGSVTASQADQALSVVLNAANSRILKLRQTPLKTKTIVDRRDALEVWLFWDTYDMKFLRWSKHWDEWDTMGGGFNCVCFIRKSIFNPFTLRQF